MVAIRSSEGEVIGLTTIISTAKARGQVEKWLVQLEASVKASIKKVREREEENRRKEGEEEEEKHRDKGGSEIESERKTLEGRKERSEGGRKKSWEREDGKWVAHLVSKRQGRGGKEREGGRIEIEGLVGRCGEGER